VGASIPKMWVARDPLALGGAVQCLTRALASAAAS
jgi:hypothetical protein